MRVLLLAYGSHGDVESTAGLAVRLRTSGADVRAGAPPDCVARRAAVNVPLMHGAPPAGGVITAGGWL